MNANGRIIGFHPCKHYGDGKAEGAGFVIEIQKGVTLDTVVTFDIPDGLFNFLREYRDGYSSFLFRPDLQDIFRINFNYKYAEVGEKTRIICNGMINIAPFSEAVKDREILIISIYRL